MVQGISEFFAGKTVFVTGGSGFIGKVLIEKLLRSCPDMKRLYITMRAKRGMSIQERVNVLTGVELFDKLKEERPEIIGQKLIPIESDMMKPRLGLSDEDYNRLVKEVDVIFHSAATVRFDQPLLDAYRTNASATKEMIEMAREMKRLQVFLHVSTTYCNCDRGEVDEIIYPEHASWREMDEIVNHTDKATLDILAQKISNYMPNTYVFTKSIAEHIVNDNKDELPLVIFRPSVVISSLEDPIPGWVDNFNGPVGLLLGIGKGLLRSSFLDKDVVMAYLPVDIAVKAMIIAAWKRAVYGSQKPTIDIYNGASIEHSVSFRELQNIASVCLDENPLESSLWYYSSHITQNKLLYLFIIYFQQVLPALLIDYVLKLTGRKPLLFRIQTKIFQATIALQYFLKRTWIFHNNNFVELCQIVPPKDSGAFGYDFDSIVPMEFFKRGAEGGKRYLLKEKVGPEHRERAKRRFKQMYYLHVVVSTLWYAFLAWIAYKVYLLYKPHEYFISSV